MNRIVIICFIIFVVIIIIINILFRIFFNFDRIYILGKCIVNLLCDNIGVFYLIDVKNIFFKYCIGMIFFVILI